MGFYLRWGQEWLKSQEEKAIDQQALNTTKNSMSDAEIEILGKKSLDFQSMNPNEDSNLPIAAASMGLSSKEYYNLWTQTNTDIPDIKEEPNKKRTQSYWDRAKEAYTKTRQVTNETQKELFGESQLRKSTAVNSLLVGLNAWYQKFQVAGMNSFAIASKAELERLAREQGKELDRDYSRFVGDPETEDNEIPLTWKIKSMMEGVKTASIRGALEISRKKTGKDIPTEILNLAPLAITDNVTYLNTKKDFKFAETDLEVINKHFPSVYAENLKIQQDGEVREPTTQERLDAYIDTVNQLYGSANPNGIETFFGSNQYFQEAMQTREGFKKYSIPATPGDMVRYTLTGSLGGEYSPLNNVIADIKLETEGEIAN